MSSPSRIQHPLRAEKRGTFNQKKTSRQPQNAKTPHFFPPPIFSTHWKHFFQSLENSRKNFPIIGKTAPIFPTIGNIFSNHWKTFPLPSTPICRALTAPSAHPLPLWSSRQDRRSTLSFWIDAQFPPRPHDGRQIPHRMPETSRKRPWRPDLHGKQIVDKPPPCPGQRLPSRDVRLACVNQETGIQLQQIPFGGARPSLPVMHGLRSGVDTNPPPRHPCPLRKIDILSVVEKHGRKPSQIRQTLPTDQPVGRIHERHLDQFILFPQPVVFQKRTKTSLHAHSVTLAMKGTDNPEIRMPIQCADKSPDGVREKPCILIQQINRIRVPDGFKPQIVRPSEPQIPIGRHHPYLWITVPQPLQGIVIRRTIDNHHGNRKFRIPQRTETTLQPSFRVEGCDNHGHRADFPPRTTWHLLGRRE